jgi:hypothetical protein
MAAEQTESFNLSIDKTNLYREETFSDLRVGNIRRLSPVKPDGSQDKSRKTLFVGQTHVVTPKGPVPIQGVIQAKDLQQAIKKFPEAMKAAMDQMVAEAKKIQQEEASRIIVPGR